MFVDDALITILLIEATNQHRRDVKQFDRRTRYNPPDIGPFTDGERSTDMAMTAPFTVFGLAILTIVVASASSGQTPA